jgi:hypothetical protein
MEKIICLKSFTTPKGKNFEKGKEYTCELYMNTITVYENIYSKFGFKIKTDKFFSKYFKFNN